MIRAIAIDDDQLALTIIERYCDMLDFIVIEKTFTCTDKARKYLSQFPVDLLFLDIDMPVRSGIDFYRSLHQDIPVIFTTAYSKYAIDGFDLHATDYLLKPFSPERFVIAMERSRKQFTFFSPMLQHCRVAVRADYKLLWINSENILLIEGADDYIKIHLENKSVVTTRMSMGSILQKLPSGLFVRVHRSYIVPRQRVRASYGQTVQIDDFVIPVGDTYKTVIRQLV
ncbi:LytTR family DNA-binding domain-containing protein [Flavobacterium sp. DGU11]|uniref:LytTR family DNA-binding domain-containing protein n=1 Tax=Flavobacterium arundinis TaxID=3139143 RepID=A0ABU9HRM7_9FLAO